MPDHELRRVALLELVAELLAEHARTLRALAEVREQCDAFRDRAASCEAVRAAENAPRKRRKGR